MMAVDNRPQPLSRAELLDLYKVFNSAVKDELSFFFQYFHFYIGLLSAILAVTLTGLLSIGLRNPRGLVLLVGPILILTLSWVGYNNLQAFYRRFSEAWVTKINLESMLNMRPGSLGEQDIQKPIYASRKGGFMPEIEWRPLKEVFEEAEKDAWPAEQVAHRLVEVGTTLANARWTFNLFKGAAGVLAVVIVLIVVL
jgi:hypothetical protein